MSRIFLYAHGGSGNHGCEAIVRSTIKILKNQNVVLISSKPEEDKKYELEKICKIIKDVNENYSKRDIDFIKAYLKLKLKKDYIPMDKMRYKETFSNLKEGDIAFSIGGDNYCYANVAEYVMLHDILKEKKVKTVLWGCSIEPEVMQREEIVADLKRYDLITARETITYENLKRINKNTILVSDPAFCLGMEETILPSNFIIGNTVGINLSPMVINNEKISGITWKNYEELIEYILKETTMNIAFIPHVVWNDGDDRIPLKKLYLKYQKSGRVCIVEDNNCKKLKYVISKCRFFLGARTHSTIAAYSSEIPTLVLGYSVKARGIAKDLFGDAKKYVIPVQEIKNEKSLKDAFMFIIENEENIKLYLKNKIPEYQRGVYAGIGNIKCLMEEKINE